MTLRFPLRSAFVAIPLDETARAAFGELQDRLREFDDMLRFQNPASPHLTLQFWRELMEIEYHQVLPQCQRIASTSLDFSLKIQGVSTFGKRGAERVLFLDVPFNEELARLKKRCPWPSMEAFSPHVTLAWIKHPQKFAVHRKKIMKLIDSAHVETRVDRVRLYAEVEAKKQTTLEDFVFPA